MSSDSPNPKKIFKPFDLSTTEHRVASQVPDPKVQSVIRILEDRIYSLRGMLNRLEIPIGGDEESITIEEAKEVNDALAPTPTPAGSDCVAVQLVATASVSMPIAGTVPNNNFNHKMIAQGDYLFVLRGSRYLEAWFIRDASAPEQISAIKLSDIAFFIPANNIAIQGHFLYLLSYSQNMSIWNIEDPTDMIYIANLDLSSVSAGQPDGFAVQGTWAYIAISNSTDFDLVVTDISNPELPEAVHVITTGTTSTSRTFMNAVATQGEYLFVGDGWQDSTNPGSESFYVFHIEDPATIVPTLVATVATSNSMTVYDFWLDGRYLYVVGAYAVPPSSTGGALIIYDIIDPNSPVELTVENLSLDFPTTITGQGTTIYIGSLTKTRALLQYDISDPLAPTLLNTIAAISGSSYGKPYTQGNYLWLGTASFGNSENLSLLESFNLGGTFCEKIETAQLWAYERIFTNFLETKKLYVKEQLVTWELLVNHILNVGGACMFWGHGTPETFQIAQPSSLFFNVDCDFDGNDPVYVKATGYGNTGWVALGTGGGGGGITELTGDVTAGPGSGSQAATIANDAVTFAKMQNISTQTLIGRDTAATGSPEEVTISQALDWLP